MRVDVVTAAHLDYARYLPAAWESLRRQTSPHWTWRLQLDGPPDETAELDAILDACGASADGRVSIGRHGTREGPAVTRNIALGGCIEQFVQNLDADDELEPHTLAALRGALTAHPTAGYAVGHARDLRPDGTLEPAPLDLPPGELARGALAVRWQAKLATGRVLPPVHPAGVMWRRTLLITLGGWSALRGVEDTATLLAGSALATGVLLDLPTLRYRQHDAQHSRQHEKFSGGGVQHSLILQRVALLTSTPSWVDQVG